MQLVSEKILTDSFKPDPKFEAVYPRLDGYKLWDPSSWTNGHPHQFYARMREEAPVMWSEMGKRGSGFWSVTRYEDLRSVELNPAVFSSERGSINMAIQPRENWKPAILMEAAMNSLINLDAPRHMEMRMQQLDFFIPRYVAELKEKVEKKVSELLDNVEANGPEVDFVRLFSQELPLFTLCEMLGVDEADRPKIIKWMHYLELAAQYTANPWKVIMSEPLFPMKFFKNVDEMFAYGKQVMADRRANPRNDLLSAIANAKLDGEELPQEFLDGSWLLIIFAGNDTTRNSVSGTLRLLTQFPDQREMVLSDRSMIPAMSQEALRLVSPVVHMRRTALEDTELNGQKIAKDEKVVLWYGAANRDPSVFPDPDRMDMTRENVDKHLAFGHGVHKCMGFRVAQMQLRIAYEQIFDRFPNIHWTGKQKIAPNALVHAISSLKVNLYGPNGVKPTRVSMASA
jgi:hypothetical protein